MATSESIWPKESIHMDSTNSTIAASKDMQFVALLTQLRVRDMWQHELLIHIIKCPF